MPTLKQEIEVVQGQKGEYIGVLKRSWDKADPTALVDITGYVVQLVVKQDLSDESPWFTITASITGPEVGEYTFAISPLHSFRPAGTWPGEIRFYSTGDTALPPDHVIPVDYVVWRKV